MISRTDDEGGQSDLEHPDTIHIGSLKPGGQARVRELIVDNASPLNLRLHSPSVEDGLFFVENSTFTPKKPHVILHAGPDKLGSVLGVAYLSYCGTNMVGLGDPKSNINSMVWENLSRSSTWTHSRYQFESIFGEEGRKPFVWQRVRQNPFDDQGDWELFEDGKPDAVLARYVGVGIFRWKKRGRIFIHDGYGAAWQLMVLLTGMALIELSRRRARERRHC